MLPGRSPANAPSCCPSCPQRISCKAGGSLTMVKRISEAAAASRGVFASFAPAATNSEAREGVRFHTVTLCPALSRFMLIGRPINPSPINPISFEVDPLFTIYLLAHIPVRATSIPNDSHKIVTDSGRRVGRSGNFQAVLCPCGRQIREVLDADDNPDPALAAAACEFSTFSAGLFCEP